MRGVLHGWAAMERATVVPLSILSAAMCCCTVQVERITPVIINATDQPVEVELSTRDHVDRERDEVIVSLAPGGRLERASIAISPRNDRQRPRARIWAGPTVCEVSFSERVQTYEVVREGDGVQVRAIETKPEQPE
ncbi:MAG: hypothetical protein AMXMBFR58_20110 [Phycisphaerae bacterium]